MVLTRRRYTFDEWLEAAENAPRSELVGGIPVFPDITVPTRDLFVEVLEPERPRHGRDPFQLP